MRFSMIIPIHNAEKRIYALMQSIQEQTFKDFEVIAVCDKCEDNTFETVSEYSETINMKVVECEHGNSGMARNEGLKIAEGEYVLFADDDDFILHKNVFEEIDRMIYASDNVDILFFGFIFGDHGYAHPLWNNGHFYGNVWSKAWKREFIGDTRFPNVYPDDDLQFCKLMEAKNPKIFICDAPIYYYNYMRPGSITWKESNGRTD